MSVADDVKPGDLVGWKFRAALVLGKVVDVNEDKLTLSPVSKPESHVTRRREKVILESELDKEDVEEALREGGHMARRKLHSSSPKAEKMGLSSPHQLMPEDEAHAAKAKREHAYKEEAVERSSKKRSRGKQQEEGVGEGGKKGGGKKQPAESPHKKHEGNESPPAPASPKSPKAKKAAKKSKQ